MPSLVRVLSAAGLELMFSPKDISLKPVCAINFLLNHESWYFETWALCSYMMAHISGILNQRFAQS